MTDPKGAGGALTPVTPMSFPDTVVLGDVAGGIAFIPASTPLIGLNYYDGRFLRADDLNLERRAQRAYVEYGNRAGGAGVVHGFDLSLAEGGAKLHLTDGLAVDPRGRLLFLPESVEAKVADLVAAASKQSAAGTGTAASAGMGFAPCVAATATTTVATVAGSQLFVVCLAHAEGLCGNAEVFGRLCADACVTATDRPYVLDGVVLLLCPLSLGLVTSQAVILSSVHLRSRVASAYFAEEWAAGGSLLSAAGLASPVWCHGAPAVAGDAVPIGVLEWKGTSAGFLDDWTARREVMEMPPRRYWAGRMELRPWPVFLAQVLQFQCQLGQLLGAVPAQPEPSPGPCGDAHQLLGESATMMGQLIDLVKKTSGAGAPADLPDVDAFSKKVAAGLTGQPARLLVDGGIVELPAAGYLPVDPASQLSVRDQVQRLMGQGVDLRVCALRRDQIAHELERAQHMNRISLLKGLDDPKAPELVDILVPDGQVAGEQVPGSVGLDLMGTYGFARGTPQEGAAGEAGAAGLAPLPFQGAARVEAQGTTVDLRAAAVSTSGQGLNPLFAAASGILRGDVAASVAKLREAQAGAAPAPADLPRGTAGRIAAVYASLSLGANPFQLQVNQSAHFTATVDAILPSDASAGHVVVADGDFVLEKLGPGKGGLEATVKVTGTVGEQGKTTNSFTVGLVLGLDRQTNQIKLTVLQPPDPKWQILASWSGGPGISGSATLDLLPAPASGQSASLLEASAHEDASIADQQNAFHKAAMAALGALTLLHPGDPGWMSQAAEQLFPAPSAAVVEIHPTTDWVLFRRRRFEECAGAVPAPAAVSKVPAWVVRAGNEGAAADIAGNVKSGQPIPLGWTRIDLEFEPASTTLRTSVPVLKNRYAAAGGGGLVYLAGYASNGPAGRDVLPGRVQTLLSGLSGVAALGPSGTLEELANPPSTQMVPGTEASIFLVTYPVPALKCVDVFAVDRFNSDLAGQIMDAVSTGNADALAQLNDSEKIVFPLGSVTFDNDVPVAATVGVVADALKAHLTDIQQQHQRPGNPFAAYGWIASDWTDPKADDQINASAKALGVGYRGSSRVSFPHVGSCPSRAYILIDPVGGQ
jgi:hypothetical protein